MILITFSVNPASQYLLVGNKLQVLPDGIAHKPNKRIIPIDDTQQLRQKDIHRMPLPDMHILMQNDIRPLYYRMQPRIDINTTAKRKRSYRLIDLVDLYPILLGQPCPKPNPAKRQPSHHKP